MTRPLVASLAMLLVALLLTPAAEARGPSVAAAQEKKQGVDPVRSAWARLGQTTNTCDSFDYFPQGGPRIFWCHLESVLPYAQLAQLSGGKVFLDGPHTDQELKLDAKRSFGRYNPRFVGWAMKHLVPGAEDAGFRMATQPLYDQFVKPLATAFWITWRKAEAEPHCFHREVERYRAFLAGKAIPEMPYERYFFFMNRHFCKNPDGGFDYFHGRGFDEGTNGNVVKTATAWWIRRIIDGTAQQWARGLKKLLRTYDPALLTAGAARKGEPILP